MKIYKAKKPSVKVMEPTDESEKKDSKKEERGEKKTEQRGTKSGSTKLEGQTVPKGSAKAALKHVLHGMMVKVHVKYAKSPDKGID